MKPAAPVTRIISCFQVGSAVQIAKDAQNGGRPHPPSAPPPPLRGGRRRVDPQFRMTEKKIHSPSPRPCGEKVPKADEGRISSCCLHFGRGPEPILDTLEGEC